MPISDEAIQKETNRFIAVKAEAKVGQAMAAFKALEAQPWWHLVVRMPDGAWAVSRFRDLSTPEGDPSELSVHQLQSLIPAPAAERDSVETRAAQAQARQSPSRVLVVTVKENPVGILVEGTRRSAGLAKSVSVDQLGGKYIKLKDYGSILLGSSKK